MREDNSPSLNVQYIAIYQVVSLGDDRRTDRQTNRRLGIESFVQMWRMEQVEVFATCASVDAFLPGSRASPCSAPGPGTTLHNTGPSRCQKVRKRLKVSCI